MKKKAEISSQREKQPIKAHSGKPFKKKAEIPSNNVQLTKVEARQQAKERTEARKKKRRPHYTMEQELASLWEKMRRRNIAKDERSKLVTEALQKMKGKVPEIASSHVSSRVCRHVLNIVQTVKGMQCMRSFDHIFSLSRPTPMPFIW